MTSAPGRPFDRPPDRPIALTMGEAAGIGGDITLKAWLARTEDTTPPFFVLDDAARLKELAGRLNLDVPVAAIDAPEDAPGVFAEALPVLHRPLAAPVAYGQPDPANAPATVQAIDEAVALTRAGRAAAVVTNPISKAVLYDAGFTFPGHTEYLAHLDDGADPVMMLAGPELRVVLATVHVALKDAVATLTTDAIVHVARITHAALKRDFAIDAPVLAVAGLNPHAGEGGAMGGEETSIIEPAIAQLQADGIDARGPFPPDTLFTAHARAGYDAAVCMYHDQGLIPLKALDFERGVNATLGLSFVRTSPDHGTAFEIAGTGRASALSLIEALNMAAAMAAQRAQGRGA